MLKKILALLAVLALTLTLVACGGKSGSGETKPDGKVVGPAAGPEVTADGVTFKHKPEGAPSAIFLAGSFNGWKPDDPNYALDDADGDGTWELTVPIDPGSYQYKFVVDGTWTQDKSNPKDADDGFGGKNSVIDVQ
jgi:predicted small lipoprotein YifL